VEKRRAWGDPLMRIVAVREKTVPIASAIRNAAIDFSQMTASVLALISDISRNGGPLVGYGFNSNGRYAQGGLLRDRFIPRLQAADPPSLLEEDGSNFDPRRVWDVLMTNEKPGGHGERSVAVGVIDMALWDLVAKIEDRPLYRVIADRFNGGAAAERVDVYAAGGYYYPGKGKAGLLDELRRYRESGYTLVKMKIAGAPLSEDLSRIEAALELVGGKGNQLAVDANGRLDTAESLRYAEAIEPYRLRWYEEPGDPLDYELHARVAEVYEPPLATGENLFSSQDVRNLLRYGGLRPDRDVVQMDPALSYGLVEYLRMIDLLGDHGWSRSSVVPHGGHQMALNIAAGLGLGGNESYPGVFQPFGGFADDLAVEDGQVALPDAPGIGLERKANLYAVLRELVA
jgi:L-alanine-DL-glutamate epimerase-like enolase superfamily enzyme